MVDERILMAAMAIRDEFGKRARHYSAPRKFEKLPPSLRASYIREAEAAVSAFLGVSIEDLYRKSA